MVSFDKFREWAEDRFDGDIQVKEGKEVKINSIFTSEPDTSHKLWCSPAGGKKSRQNGVYHCWKTNAKGSLAKLIMLVDGCDYEEAVSILRGDTTSIREMERQLEEYLNKKDGPKEEESPKEIVLSLPPYAVPLESKGWWQNIGREYLANRCIPYKGYYICTEDKYKGRIVIPYYDAKGKLIYWNARATHPKAKLRYVGPPKEVGVGKDDVIYMDRWPQRGETIHLCEGEFNAKSLTIAGFYGAACGGKNMSEKQAAMLKGYKVVICLDRDKPGIAASVVMVEKLGEFSLGGKNRIMLVRPPVGYKDWNEMLVGLGPEILTAYILRSQKPLEANAPQGTSSYMFDLLDL